MGAFSVTGSAAGRPATNADDAVAVVDELVDRESLTDLGARGGGSVEQDLVEDTAARRVGDLGAVRGRRHAGQGERPDVECQPTRGRNVRRGQLLEETPAVQVRHPGLMDVVRRERVARKAGPVYDENPVAPAGEQHCGRRSRGAGADDDCVVHRGSSQ